MFPEPSDHASDSRHPVDRAGRQIGGKEKQKKRKHLAKLSRRRGNKRNTLTMTLYALRVFLRLFVIGKLFAHFFVSLGNEAIPQWVETV